MPRPAPLEEAQRHTPNLRAHVRVGRVRFPARWALAIARPRRPVSVRKLSVPLDLTQEDCSDQKPSLRFSLTQAPRTTQDALVSRGNTRDSTRGNDKPKHDPAALCVRDAARAPRPVPQQHARATWCSMEKAGAHAAVGRGCSWLDRSVLLASCRELGATSVERRLTDFSSQQPARGRSGPCA